MDMPALQIIWHSANIFLGRCDEGSWDNDPHRHGRFTIIANRGYDSLYNSIKEDAWLPISENGYSVHNLDFPIVFY